MDFANVLSSEFKIKPEYSANLIKLFEEGNTIPFIARYRKEQHGTMDDQQIRLFSERYEYLQNLEKRKGEISASIEGQDKMTEELAAAIERAATLSELEDIYRPYKPKRKTRASVAREKGLEPLAAAIMAQEANGAYPIDMAKEYISEETDVETAEAALSGAMDIIAEDISDNADIRRRLKNVIFLGGRLVSLAADKEAESVYTSYYDFAESVKTVAGHRILAVDRGEKEGFLKVSVSFDTAKAHSIIYSVVLKDNGSPSCETVTAAANDAYDRLIFPSIEREVRNELTLRADISAIGVFSTNLRQLLMQPPVRNKVTLGLDPGYRTGCKVAVVDGTGRVLETGVIYPAPPHKKTEEAKRIVGGMCRKYGVEVMAIGNGTASKETEMFASSLIAELGMGISYMVVSEAGASVYSASPLAAKEFPEFDVSLRSAVSIARRLQDPLAELVKIDPKAIGVGQYQHDMPPKMLDEALGGVVEDCVNSVGVDLNTASPSLLSRVAGLSAAVSKNIVDFREENGAFTSRKQLLKVAKLGPKAYTQCAGFCRIAEGKDVLDNTGVHPESYDAAKTLLTLCGYDLKDVSRNEIDELPERIAQLGEEALAQKLSVGVPTLRDIAKELAAPGRDPRDSLPAPMLRTDILDIKDLKAGMELDGTVRNVIDFGAFIDIGVHQDGLVHISQICNHYIKHPSEKLKVGDIVKVWVMSVDAAKKRISLTMKGEPIADEKK
ncbi:MAG: RNA-binding transcriptional accessory protein [Oscillospiraceae bacterium]|nr:RNA-binding transcriptional accessory protein [Oscillospiraceae bacterium]